MNEDEKEFDEEINGPREDDEGNDQKKMKKKVLRMAMDSILNWFEEIFSDIFGIFSGLEPSVLTLALSMIADNLPSQIYSKRGIHPVDAIRVTIYLYTINQIENALNQRSVSYTLSHGYLKVISNSIIAYTKETNALIRQRASHSILEPNLIPDKDKNQDLDIIQVYADISKRFDISSKNN